MAPQGLATLQACVWMGQEKHKNDIELWLGKYQKVREDQKQNQNRVWIGQDDKYNKNKEDHKQNQTWDWTPSTGLDFPLHHLVCHNVNQVHHNVTMSPCQSS